MSGLLSGVLPAVFSQADRAKRFLGGLLSDPVGRVEQSMGQAQADLSKMGLLSEQAFSDPRNPMKMQDNAASRQLVDTYLNSVMNFAPVGMNVWHGSPHKFDRFDSSKIGTGEGAQAYGHGLYLAESKDVAREYQTKLSSTGGAKNLASQYGGVDDGLAEAQKRIDHYKKMIADGGGGDLRRANSMLAIAQKNFEDLSAMKMGMPENTGALYKVDLPDEAIVKMLDWDKPLSQQNVPLDVFGVANRQQLRKLPSEFGNPRISPALAQEMVAGKTGSQAYRMLVDAYGPESAALALKRSGIPGIRYLDEGSRQAGAGTSNFVVFPGNESLLSILERNGQPIR